MKDKKWIRQSLWLAAIFIGVMLGSFGYFAGLRSAKVTHSVVVDEEAVTSPLQLRLSGAPSDNSPVAEFIPYEEDKPQVQLPSGARLIATYNGGIFIGYVVENAGGDPRFQQGQVIVAVNGVPVEDSAAGSELLLIGLQQDGAQIAFSNDGAE